MAALPLLPSLVAVMDAEPAATALTRPLSLTVATAGLLLDHVTTRPFSVLLAESFVTAESCCVPPTTIVAAAGLTVTEATGTTITVIAAVPLLPSLVAVIVAEPAATPVTKPLLLTVATAVLLLDHVTTRPVRVPPAESLVTAESCRVPPTKRLADAGLTVTDATGTIVTVMTAVPLLPSLAAVIVAEPAATPVTKPALLTVATAALLLAQVTTRPASELPAESFVTAESCGVAPTAMLADVGLTVTEATGTLATVMVALLLLPSLVAVTVADPRATAVTRPLPLTVATAELLLAQVTTRPMSALPAESLGTAVSCAEEPTKMVAELGEMVTAATGTGLTVTVAVAVFPSLVAVIVALPADTPRARPLMLTVATAGLSVAHVMTRPASGLPAESIAAAVNCCAAPIQMAAVAGDTVTEVTATDVTMTVAESAAEPELAFAFTLYCPGEDGAL